MARLPFLLLLCFPLLIQAAPAEAPEDEASSHQQKLDLLRKRISGLQQRMEMAQGERSELGKQLQQSEQQVGKLARGLRVLKGRIERQQARMQTLAGQEAEQQAALTAERRLLEQQVRSAYAMGRQDYLKILLNQQDPSEVARALAYYEYVNRERMARMAVIRERLVDLADTQRALKVERDRLQGLRMQQQQELAELEQAQVKRREVVAKLGREISDQGRQLGQLKQDEHQLQSLLRGLQEALADVPVAPVEQRPFKTRRGRLSWPTRGVIQHTFGEPKIGRLRWDGVMISAPEGNEVRAVHSGRVAFADWLRGFGLLLIVDHGDGYMTLYGHNQSLFKEAGDWVDAGEPVAAVGDTGGRQQSGVYFAIRRNGKAVNPRKWCRRPNGRKVGAVGSTRWLTEVSPS